MRATYRLSFYALAGILIAATTIAAVNFSLPSLRVQAGTIVLSVAYAHGNSSDTDLEKLYLTIDQIMVHRTNETDDDGRNWHNITVPAKTVELLSLRNLSEDFPQIATASLPTGTYNLIWLRIVSATATIDGENETLWVPSGILKIPQIRFTISDGGITNILIDIGYESMHERNLILRPVAHILSQSQP